jgi:hypothetical protein
VYPARLPDLYIGQPLELVARERQAPGDQRPARARNAHLSVDLPPAAEGDSGHACLGARATLLDEARADVRQSESLRGKDHRACLQHRLITPYAFVAVDSETTGARALARAASRSPCRRPKVRLRRRFGAPPTGMAFAAAPPAAMSHLRALPAAHWAASPMGSSRARKGDASGAVRAAAGGPTGGGQAGAG